VFYNLNWKASTSQQFVKSTSSIIGGKGLGLALDALLMGTNWIYGSLKLFPSIFTEVSQVFKDAKKNAKVSGRILACALASGYLFKNQTVSLIGFSLGCQVIKSCLKTLDQLEARHIIHQITFLGGAVDNLDKEKHFQLWTGILAR
jgi:hypothetical protein